MRSLEKIIWTKGVQFHLKNDYRTLQCRGQRNRSTHSNHWATGCVKRTIGCINKIALTYAKEEKHGNIETMVERCSTVCTKRFPKNVAIRGSSWPRRQHRVTQFNQKTAYLN